jgi:predicted nucleic acid-binding Zn ribbon protein
MLRSVLVQAALAAGWQDVDIRGWFDPRPCAFCRKPLPEGLTQNARYCSHLCAQAAYYERKVGRRTVSRRRGDRPHCDVCGAELPAGSGARRCPNCRVRKEKKQRTAAPVEVVPETRTCPACGTAFEVLPPSRRVYCSNRCKYRTKDRRKTEMQRGARAERS